MKYEEGAVRIACVSKASAPAKRGLVLLEPVIVPEYQVTLS